MQTTSQQNTSPSHDQIAQIAQSLWQQTGRPNDRDLEFWLKAEQRIKAPPGAQSSGSKAGEQRQKASSQEVLSSAGNAARRDGKRA